MGVIEKKWIPYEEALKVYKLWPAGVPWFKPTNMTNQTLGEQRIRTTFNPGNNDKVQNLKEKFAHLYNDLLNALSDKNDYSEEAIEARRCMDKSLNLLEESAMFAVKSVTS